eukprot:2130529-Prorocentrum_lima.AAC.1
MLNARVRVTLTELNDKIKAMLLHNPCAANDTIPRNPAEATPRGPSVTSIPQVTVTLTWVGGRCSLALPTLC